MMFRPGDCWECRHHRRIPGTPWIRCNSPEKGNFTVRIRISGTVKAGMIWPLKFTAYWVKDCKGFEGKPNLEGPLNGLHNQPQDGANKGGTMTGKDEEAKKTGGSIARPKNDPRGPKKASTKGTKKASRKTSKKAATKAQEESQGRLPGTEQASADSPILQRVKDLVNGSEEYLKKLEERMKLSEKIKGLQDKRKEIDARLEVLAFQMAKGFGDPQMRLDEWILSEQTKKK